MKLIGNIKVFYKKLQNIYFLIIKKWNDFNNHKYTVKTKKTIVFIYKIIFKTIKIIVKTIKIIVKIIKIIYKILKPFLKIIAVLFGIILIFLRCTVPSQYL